MTKSYIAIELKETGETETYSVDTDGQVKEAQQALRDHGLDSAPVFVGEPDGSGDSYPDGNVLFAGPC
jgi:hypothetical protein